MINFSKTSKMPSRSWSLQALTTCPASKDKGGELVPACKGCYATKGFYHMKNVKLPRIENQKGWKEDSWINDMVKELDNDRYFRWFDSGDIYDLRLAEKIYEVCKLTPWVKHWIPTRMHKFDKFKKVLDKIGRLSNVVVRLSSDGINAEVIKGKNTSTIYKNDSQLKNNMVKCLASEQKGKCLNCRACWNKDIKIIAYKYH